MGTMGSSLSSLVPSGERALVRATAERLAGTPPGPALAVSQALAVSPRLRRRLCFVIAAIAPELPQERLLELVQYALWSILLDDQLDRRDAGPAALRRVRAVVATAIAGQRGEAAAEPLGRVLADLLVDLAARDPEGGLFARLCRSLQDAVATGANLALLGRAVARGAAPPPTAERYLAVAARTVNYRSFAYALLLADARPPSPATVDQLEPALWHGAYAVRLSNDLASAARDRAERSLNVLSLRDRRGTPVTARYVRRRITGHVRAHHQRLRMLTEPELAGPAQSLARCLRVSVGLYLHTDLR